jgi:hypothetical protein
MEPIAIVREGVAKVGSQGSTKPRYGATCAPGMAAAGVLLEGERFDAARMGIHVRACQLQTGKATVLTTFVLA